MDWYSWLSKTALDPSLTYEYGLAFSRNELQKEDLVHFNHEFLMSMGISVAKHRLEILKLAKKEAGSAPTSLSKLALAITKTKKCFNKYVNKLVHHENTVVSPLPEPPPRYREQWRGALTRKCKSEKELKVEQPIPRTRKIAKSGPLDMRAHQQEPLLLTNRALKLSGPLDRKMQEKMIMSYRSPMLSGPLDGKSQERLLLTGRSPRRSGPLYPRPPRSPRIHSDYTISREKAAPEYGDNTLWATLFHDMKPT